MAIDWDRVLGGALNQVTGELQTRSAEARQFEKEQKEAAQRSYSLLQQRDMRAKQAGQLGRRAIKMGASQDQVYAAMSSGATGIQDFLTKLEEAAAQMPGGRLGKSDIEAIISMSNIPAIDKKYVDMELDKFAAMTYGAGSKDSYQAPTEKQGFFASLLKPMGGVERRLDEQTFAGEMSIADVNAAAREAEYRSLMPEATLNLRDIKYYNADSVKDFTTSVLDAASKATTSTSGKAAIEQARGAAIQNGEDPLEAEKKMAALLRYNATESLVRWGAETYFEGGFFRNKYTEDLIVNQLGYGQKFYDNLKDEFGATDITEEGTTTTPLEDQTKEALGVTMKPEVEPKITLPPTDTKYKEQEALSEEEIALVEEAMSDELKQGFTTKYTRSQWYKMKDPERRERGLPESIWGITGFAFRDDIDELPAIKNTKILRNLDKDTYKVNFKGRGVYHVTKEQLESITERALIAGEPALEIMEYKAGEKKAKNVPSNLLKQYQLGE